MTESSLSQQRTSRSLLRQKIFGRDRAYLSHPYARMSCHPVATHLLCRDIVPRPHPILTPSTVVTRNQKDFVMTPSVATPATQSQPQPCHDTGPRASDARARCTVAHIGLSRALRRGRGPGQQALFRHKKPYRDRGLKMSSSPFWSPESPVSLFFSFSFPFQSTLILT